jgi:hypothetical protein
MASTCLCLTRSQNEKDRETKKDAIPRAAVRRPCQNSVGTSLWQPLSDGHEATVTGYSNIAGYKVQVRVCCDRLEG